jgi:hypothetical protein
VGWRVEKKSIDLGAHGKVACGGGEGISYRISGEKDDDRIETGCFPRQR